MNNKQEIKSNKNTALIFIITLAILAILSFVIYKTYSSKTVEEVDTSHIFKKHGELTFLDSTQTVTKTKIDIEIAKDDFSREQGLMNRSSMEEKQGMLFIFPVEQPQLSFWMHNTLISLDLLYIDKDRKIFQIYKNAPTLSDKSMPSIKPGLYVVEVIGGYTDKYDIKVGDYINYLEIK